MFKAGTLRPACPLTEFVEGMALTTQFRRFVLAGLLAALVMAFTVLAVSVSASSSTDLPASQDLPSGVVAAVLYPPTELQTITIHDFEHAMAQATAQAGLKRTPSPGEKGYWKLKVSAMKSLLGAKWIFGQAAEMGIDVTSRQVAKRLARIKKDFKTQAEYRKFLKRFHFTQSDVNELIELELLSTAIEAKVTRDIEDKELRRQALAKFFAEFTKRWRSRTVCAPEYIFASCSNMPESPTA